MASRPLWPIVVKMSVFGTPWTVQADGLCPPSIAGIFCSQGNTVQLFQFPLHDQDRQDELLQEVEFEKEDILVLSDRWSVLLAN